MPVPNPFIGKDTEEQERLDYTFARILSEADVLGLSTAAVEAVVNVTYNTDDRWVNRGDPASVDFSIAGGELTDDGAWHDLDLTSVHVEITNKMVLLRGYIQSGGVATMSLREKGNVNDENAAEIHPPSGGATWAGLMVIPDADGIIQYKIDAAATAAELTVAAWVQNFSSGTVEGASSADVELNTTHRLGDGTDHAEVAQALLDILTNAANIATNVTAIGLNTTHRTSDGTDHSHVGLNDTHRGSDGTDHSHVGLNNTHRASAGTDHSDVGLNNTHRASNGTDHGYIDQDVTIGATGVVHDGLQVVTKLIIPVYTVSGEPL